VPVGCSLADVVTQVAEEAGRPFHRSARLVVDREAERRRGGEMDRDAPGRSFRCLRVGLRRLLEPVVVAGLVTGHDVEREGGAGPGTARAPGPRQPAPPPPPQRRARTHPRPRPGWGPGPPRGAGGRQKPPPRSLPSASPTMPAATAAALPPEEPPAPSSRFH